MCTPYVVECVLWAVRPQCILVGLFSCLLCRPLMRLPQLASYILLVAPLLSLVVWVAL